MMIAVKRNIIKIDLNKQTFFNVTITANYRSTKFLRLKKTIVKKMQIYYGLIPYLAMTIISPSPPS